MINIFLLKCIFLKYQVISSNQSFKLNSKKNIKKNITYCILIDQFHQVMVQF